MLVTSIILVLYVSLWVLSAVLWALCLRRALRSTKVSNAGGLRVASVPILIVVLNPLVTVLLITALLFRPYVAEAFSMPSNPMAPTLLGEHRRGVCPVCGESAVCPALDGDYSGRVEQWMICEKFHVSKAESVGQSSFGGDRFLVAKFVAPQRWDIVAFRYPADPSQIYAFRLVGLPGETIEIRDGVVWADGKKLIPPPSISGIEYLAELPFSIGPVWGSADHPAQLGSDEYFVLGDFSLNAKDSRMWTTGATGHPPYAVPQSHVIGVVTTIYWPRHRWQAYH